MKYIKLLTLFAVAGFLVVSLITVPLSIVWAQTGSAELCQRVTGPILVGSGAMGCQYPDRGLYLIHYIDGQFVEIALFSLDQVADSADDPISVTDARTGYKTTLSPSTQGDDYRTVEILDSWGNPLSTFDIELQ